MSIQKNLDDNLYENSSLEFESLLNSINEWENNPIEATRHCFKNLYNIIRYQQKKIEIINKNKVSNIEFNSGLNIKLNITDFMSTINEITQKIEKRPTNDQINLSLDEKISKKDINDILKTKPSLEEIKTYLNSGDIKINIDNIIEDLNRNFVDYKNLGDILSTKPSKENILNLLNQKVNKNDLERINNELKNIHSLNNKVQEIDNNLEKFINNINQQVNNINNEYKNKIDNIQFKKVINQINSFESKLNNYSNDFNNSISDLVKKINLIINKYELIDKNIKKYDNNFKEILNKEKDNSLSTYIENHENKIKSINNDINKIYNLLENKINKNEIELYLKLKEKNVNSNSNSIIVPNQKYITSQEIENFYNSICNDIHQKFVDIESYTRNFLKKLDSDISNILETKSSNEDMNIIKNDINQLKYLLDQKVDLNNMNNIEEILNNINMNYINKKEYNNFVQICQNDIEEMKNDIILKSNIEETMTYLKNKADINDVNNALNQIHDELDIKLSFQDFNHAMDNQYKINSALLQNNQVGEWIWESGLVKNNRNVPWEIQKINNCPENFIWNKDSDTIVVKQKGIYLCSMAFFTNNYSLIRLYINGEKIIGKTNDGNEYEKKENNSNEENLTGININEYLFLKEKSRISILYDGSDNVKGILALKMLCNF